MKNTMIKKCISLCLVCMMLLSVLPTALFAQATEHEYPTMEAYNSASSADYHRYYNKVYSVTFLDFIDYDAISATDTLYSWDVSAAKDASVMAWMKLNAEQTSLAGADRYDVYIGGEGGVGANPDSSWIFYAFNNLVKINNPENFKTGNATTFYNLFANCYLLASVDLHTWDVSNVTSLKNMFSKCYALTSANLSGWDTGRVTDMTGLFDMTDNTNRYPESVLQHVDLTDWDTSNVTTTENMFKNCEVLSELDLSSFNTAKLTNMRYMFYYCRALKNIYIGDGWTSESVANINDPVFNCCYAVMGGKEIYDAEFAYTAPDATYAKLKEDGGFLTHYSEKPQPEPKSYTVTYEFIGDVIPKNVTAPDAVTYNEGTTVTVADAPSADGYVFSGWSTEDAEITDGEFVINNDVAFIGSWEKVYTVSYAYADGYEVPADAPEVPACVAYKAGSAVTVEEIPFADGYVFVGWTTDDADVNGNLFSMPEQNVTLYGYFKKPVESVEINGIEDITLNKDSQTQIQVIVKPEDATVKDIIYVSEDPSVAEVDENGKITAVGAGTTTVTVYSKDDPTKKDTVTVTVKIPVTDIEVEETQITLKKGETDEIVVTVTPDDATNKELIFESGNEDVVKVDEDGNITAVDEGTTTITVTSKDNPSVKEEITVTVKIPVTDISAEDDFTLYVGEEKNVDAKVNEDATDKELIYESSDPGVAKIDNNGNVIAVGEGTTVITVTSKDDPTVKEEIVVTVEYKKYKVTYEFVGEIIPDGVSVAPMTEYKEGTTVTVATDPSAGGYVFSGWSTDDADIADGSFVIENDVHIIGSWEKLYNVSYVYTGEVPTHAPTVPATESYKAGDGVSVQTIPFADGYVFVGWTTDDAEVNGNLFSMPAQDVVLYGYFKKPVDSVEITGGDIVLNKDEDTTVNVTVKPDDATIKDLVYESADENVVTVDKNGKITAVGAGTTTVTVYSKDDPTKKDTVTVTVKIPVTDIEVEETQITLKKGETDEIVVTVTPDDATNKELIFESGDEDIVKVDENGNITAVGEGTTTVTVTSKDNPSVKEEITVNVKIPVTEISAEDDFTLYVGEEKNVDAKVNEDATDKELIYESSDPGVAKIDNNGNVIAVGEGDNPYPRNRPRRWRGRTKSP
ncbi:MAG: Ig-like domain-containing protein [Clostridia bacterium]|nr:Ig-like domain-containing protein [Clostridia bacterium]